MLYIGLMSGTSLDGADAALIDFSDQKPRVVADASSSFAIDFKASLLALNTPGDNELNRAAIAANQLVAIYAKVVAAVLAKAGVNASSVRAIGAHGQTVRHRPDAGYTIQLNNAALLAELTGIDVVADFRSADVAAGGQGAPLVPAFHQALFARPNQNVAVLNIGGMSNLTLLPATGAVQGFDCGPGNALLDFWCSQHIGQAFDNEGAWAARGAVVPGLLQKLLAEPYFALPPPKSTGRDLFNPTWLQHQLQGFTNAEPKDIQATLTALTAEVITNNLLQYGPKTQQLLVCGGGALNTDLMRQLVARLPGVSVEPTTNYGLEPLQVESAAFAWLARACMQGEYGNLPAVTGARGGRVLGALHRAPKR